jgi:hypothetical protein
LENLNDSEHINRGWENINDNTKILAKVTLGLQKQKPWFNGECSQFLHQSKQAIMQSNLTPNSDEIIGDHAAMSTNHVF